MTPEVSSQQLTETVLFFYFLIIFYLFRVDCSFSSLCPEKDNWVVVVNSVTLKTMSLWTIQPLTISCCCWLTEFPLGKLITQTHI